MVQYGRRHRRIHARLRSWVLGCQYINGIKLIAVYCFGRWPVNDSIVNGVESRSVAASCSDSLHQQVLND
jgi:hypothetical protein